MTAQVVIAARGGPDAKSRLAPLLDPVQRQALVEAMVEDMFHALRRCRTVGTVHLTTPSPDLAAMGERLGATTEIDAGPRGLNGAFERARNRIARADAQATVMLIPGDLPLILAEEVDAFLHHAAPDRVVLARATADGGTGAIALGAGVPLRLAFGPDSFTRHAAAARDLGMAVTVIPARGLGFDVDRPEDLQVLAGAEGRSADLLRRWNIPPRCA